MGNVVASILKAFKTHGSWKWFSTVLILPLYMQWHMAQIPEFQHLRLDQAGLRPRAQPGIAGCSTAAVQDLGIQVQHQEHFPNPRVHPPAHSEIPQGYMSSI